MAPKRETAQEIWGNELRHAMEAAGVKGKDLAEALNFEPSTVSNWINGKRTPDVGIVEKIEKRLGTNGYLVRDLKWVRREVSPEWSEWLTVEKRATGLQEYQTRVFPGLLQTPAYAEALLPPEKVEERLSRRKIFESDRPPFYEVLLDESTLYRQVGSPQIMAEQLTRLVEVTNPDLIVRVVPFTANLTRVTLSFLLATVDGGGMVALLDSPLRGQITELSEDMADLQRFWGQTSAEALSQQATIDLIQETIKDRWYIA
jgi:transcriptional regulator with XRE-family HTH domain